MAALPHTKGTRFASFRRAVSPARPRLVPAPAARAREPRAFPEGTTAPTLPLLIRDEMLELYAFTFCQGGFRKLGMTFEQFLLVAAALKTPDPADTREDAWAL
jgi:hypothetical protein